MLVDMEGSEGRSSWLRVAVKSLAILTIHEYSSNPIYGPVCHAMAVPAPMVSSLSATRPETAATELLGRLVTDNAAEIRNKSAA